MSEKKFTPYEVALEVLKKAQEVYNKNKTEDKDIKKFMSPTSTAPGSVATTGGTSIASQIGFGKEEKEVEGSEEDKKEDEKEDKKKQKKLPEFLKKKNLKKADGIASESAKAPKAPKAGSPQPASVSADSGWSDKQKV
jgi:hypothetical protein